MDELKEVYFEDEIVNLILDESRLDPVDELDTDCERLLLDEKEENIRIKQDELTEDRDELDSFIKLEDSLFTMELDNFEYCSVEESSDNDNILLIELDLDDDNASSLEELLPFCWDEYN